jgi:hypothetical protein
MGFLTYYSPFGIGLLVTLVLHETVLAHGPALPGWAAWPFVVGVGVGVGLLCQLMMFGVQGAFAQVLPVPGGRSIRGRGAVVGGLLLIGCVVLAVVAVLLRSEELGTAAQVVAILSLVAGVGALLTYIWCWPMAVRDFGKRGV